VTPFPVALAATFHDPTGALEGDVAIALPTLRRLYAGLAVATSPPTSPRVVTALREAGIFAGAPAENARGPLYRLAIRAALGTKAPAIHYLDFDRAIRWARRKPREIAAVLRVARRHAVLLIGRTPDAHASHHRPLWATELLANRLMADALGVKGRLDLLAPSFVVDAGRARALLRRSRAEDERVYGEWAALVPALAPTVAYLECRGLDWETPDRFRRAVRRLGLPAWRRRQETPEEWAARTAIAEAVIAGFARAHSRRRVRPRLVRLPPRNVR